MSSLKISEAGTVQFPMVNHSVEIGWTPLTPEVAREKRGGDAGAFFREDVGSKLRKFNNWLSDENARSTIKPLAALPATIEGNRELLSWMRGERQWYDETE